ncbi:uncharacterized protein MYCGRDRAFT_77372 [Zymoseptoria tritici IPO323]|uniref:Pre-rrna processing protein n=1 Tax=Zymoseptoria tritici (strain CBS 115943 / IPO323) TaxID=336722 RepID=F9XNM1_ZYMTI|nr:uncharacterized protein MYCGRDRAFT_77372 [Zymoseptoria tritici IPO323]EGP82897.1 hypothetical protein MYCGRDRAFT_77372 [Zymoseptoria tritici IPO323]
MAADDEPTRQQQDHDASERTPLISRASDFENADQSQPHRETSATSVLQALHNPKRRRWPSLVALLGLCLLAVFIIVFAFIAPTAMKEYATQAVVFEPTSLSIDSFTEDGVRARVQGDFTMDASRVKNKNVRNLGRLGTWIAREVETGESEMEVSLPEYGNVLLGTARIPGIKVYIRNGHTTHIDVLSDLYPGDVEGIRRLATDFIDGRLGQLRVIGKASVPVKSGLFSLGKQALQQEMLFANDDIPEIPKYKVKKLNFREVELPNSKGMAADVSLKVQNKYPVEFTIPPLGFGILVDNCKKSDPYIMLASAITKDIGIQPKKDVVANVTGIVRQLPAVLTQDCPGSSKSPLDNLLEGYLNGDETTIYVRGSDSPSEDTPKWITDLISDITVPVPVPGRTFGHLIKNFTIVDTHFSLPSPWAEPGTPESNPRISGNVAVLVNLPEEMNFNISVGRVRADADVYYKGKKLGRLDLDKWQPAHSNRLEDTEDGPLLRVESAIKNAPLLIEDEDVFADVVQALIFSGKSITMKIKAAVDVQVETALGEFAVRKIPAEGEVPVNPTSPSDPHHPRPPFSNLTDTLKPQLVDLRIANTTPSSLSLAATLNITNPTPYSASIPYISVEIWKNASLLAHATAHNLSIRPGRNSNLEVLALWDPLTLSGPKGKETGRQLISQYISGWNTTLTLRLHQKSFPSNPTLGRALSRFPVDFAAPHLTPEHPPPSYGDPDDDDDQPSAGSFIRNAKFHLLSSSATFTLLSPLTHSTLYITSLNATAYLPPSDPSDRDPNPADREAGRILYDEPFGVPPVAETPDGEGFDTPRLPVDWNLGSVGYGAVKRALGGELKLRAVAEVGVRLGRWREVVWFRGGGLGVGIRL